MFVNVAMQNTAEEYASTGIKFGWEVQSISQNQEQVKIAAVNRTSGERKVYRIQYAVGCDKRVLSGSP